MGPALPIISVILTVAGGIYQAVSASNTAEYNAEVAEKQAEAAQQKAAYEENLHRRRVVSLLSKQRALYGKAGVDLSGSPLLAIEDSAAQGELDALAIRYGGSIQAAQAKQQAVMYRMKGKDALIGGAFGAANSLLTGYGRYGGGSSLGGGSSSTFAYDANPNGPLEIGYSRY